MITAPKRNATAQRLAGRYHKKIRITPNTTAASMMTAMAVNTTNFVMKSPDGVSIVQGCVRFKILRPVPGC
jgi:hypothetical protein